MICIMHVPQVAKLILLDKYFLDKNPTGDLPVWLIKCLQTSTLLNTYDEVFLRRFFKGRTLAQKILLAPIELITLSTHLEVQKESHSLTLTWVSGYIPLGYITPFTFHEIS